MHPRSVRSIPRLVIAVLLSLLACRVQGSITHLVPNGYVGPVVIVFDDPGGTSPGRDERGGIIYEIPPDGVLRLRTPAPEAGLYDVEYFYLRADGTRTRVPERADSSVLQVFAVVDGATAPVEDQGSRWTWRAYIVGIPSDRHDWIEVRSEATSRAIGRKGLL